MWLPEQTGNGCCAGPELTSDDQIAEKNRWSSTPMGLGRKVKLQQDGFQPKGQKEQQQRKQEAARAGEEPPRQPLANLGFRYWAGVVPADVSSGGIACIVLHALYCMH